VRCRPRWQASDSRALAPGCEGVAAAEALINKAAAAALGAHVVEVEVERWAAGPLRECENVQVEPVGAYEVEEEEDCQVEDAREDAHEDHAQQQRQRQHGARCAATFEVRFGTVVIDDFGRRFARVSSVVLRGRAAEDGPPSTTALGLVGPRTRIAFAPRALAGLGAALIALVSTARALWQRQDAARARARGVARQPRPRKPRHCPLPPS
jgi:hypothetical protein